MRVKSKPNGQPTKSWQDASRTTKIECLANHHWVGYSMPANGLKFGTPECNEFLQFHVDVMASVGFQLVEYCVSLNEQKVSFNFLDVRKRQFSCSIEGTILGNIDANELVQLLANVGIQANIEQFELS